MRKDLLHVGKPTEIRPKVISILDFEFCTQSVYSLPIHLHEKNKEMSLFDLQTADFWA